MRGSFQVNPPGEECRRCDSRHRTWAAIAGCTTSALGTSTVTATGGAVDEHYVGHRSVNLRLAPTEQAPCDWIAEQGDCSGTHWLFRVVRLSKYLGLGP
jgi:hypothetical protein